MVAFATIFLGLVLGPQAIEVAVDGPVAVVEIHRDGEPVAARSEPPWLFVVEFGDSYEPHVLEAVAHDLYDHLRRLDAQRPALIVVELTGRAGIGAAIDDRLTRAGSSRVLTTADQIGPRVGLEGP